LYLKDFIYVISKFGASRCQIFRLKCTKFDFRWGSVSDPAGRAYSAPPDPSWKGRGKGREEEGSELEERE